jgi:hypothetical protein
MYAERDYLREHAFRRLNTELMQKGYQLNVLDLRGSSEQNQEELEKSVFRMCLKRVNECKPRMIGILGDRYGWTYYTTDVQKSLHAEAIGIRKIVDDIVLENKITHEQLLDKSITHIEIDQGLNLMDKDKCFFYFRKPLPYWRMGKNEKGIYESDKKKQDKLKNTIINAYEKNSLNIKYYQAQWTKEGTPLTGLEALDSMIYNDLKVSIFKEIDSLKNRSGHELKSSEDNELFIYAKNKCEGTIPQKQEDELFDFATTDKYKRSGLLIYGESGSGKSVLLAKLYLRLLEQTKQLNNILLVNFAGLNQSSSTLNGMLLKFIKLLQEITGKSKSIEQLETNQLIKLFKELLRSSANQKDIIILVDALDRITSEHIQFFTWLEDQLPDRVRIIASVQPDIIKKVNPYIQLYHLDPTRNQPDDIKQMLINRAAMFGKNYDAEVLTLATEKAYNNRLPLYAKILNDYLMTMTGKDYQSFSGNNAHLLWMKKEIEHMPDNISLAFNTILSRAYDAYGKDWVEAVCTIIAVSRTGIRNNDLLVTLKSLNIDTSEVKLLELRDYLSGYLRMDLGLGWWKFEFPELCREILNRQTKQNLAKFHKAIVYALIDLHILDSVRRSEFLYHCLKANLIKEATAFICNENFRNQSDSSIEQLAVIEIINTEGGLSWFQEVLKPMRSAPYPSNIFLFLFRELRGDLATKYPKQSMELLEVMIPILENRSLSRGTGFNAISRIEETSLCAQTEVLLAMKYIANKDYDSAETLIQNAWDRIDKDRLKNRIECHYGSIYPQDYDLSGIQMIVQTAWSKYLELTENKENASRIMRDNVEKLQENYEKNPQDPFLTYNFGSILITEGYACLKRGDIENAKKNCEKGIHLLLSPLLVSFENIQMNIFEAYKLRAAIEKKEKSPIEALPYYKTALEFIEFYHKQDLLNHSLAIATANTAIFIARNLIVLDRQHEMVQDVRKYCKLASDSFAYLNDDFFQGNSDCVYDFAWSLTTIGEIDWYNNDWDSALENLRNAEIFLATYSDPVESDDKIRELYSHIYAALETTCLEVENEIKRKEYRAKKDIILQLISSKTNN